jgi:hypothetical protein
MTDGSGRVFDVSGADGDVVRYAEADFDELWQTTDEHEMRRHVGLGWLLLDESASFDPGSRPSWVDTMLRRSAGRVLPAGDDPFYVPPGDAPTYVLGHLKPGHEGSPVA